MTSSLSRMTLAVGAVASVLTTGALADGPLRIPPDEPPAALSILAPDDNALAVTLSHDASLAAVAFPHPDKPKWTRVEIARAGASVRSVEVRGRIRFLRFDPEGGVLFAVANRVSRKGEAQEAWLVRIDPEALKATSSVSLPVSAAALDVWSNGGALLVACRDEVRTVLLPQVRSGPLFWIGGDNRSVASLPGGDLALVGQDAAILLVNLSDPQGRDQLPVRERVATSASVVSLSASPDGTGAVARLEDGTVLAISLDPLRVDGLGEASFVAWIGSPGPPRAARPAEAVIEEVDAASPPPPVDPPPPVPAASAVVPQPDAPDAAASEPRETPAEPTPTAEAPPPAALSASDPAAEPAQDEAPKPAAGPDLGELEGRLTGPAASAVVAVVLLGPNNITREAKRIEPAADGSWLATDLETGRYRVVLDGGGGRVLASEPAFRQSRVVAGIRVVVPAFEVLQAIDR
jgi:hypothetical protein